MGSIFNKGTRSHPRWYAKVKVAGKWTMIPTGQLTKPLAIKWLDEEEQRVGDKGVQHPSKAPLFGTLVDEWTKTLKNRTANTDRGRVKNYLVPAFGERRLREITTGALLDWLDDPRCPAPLEPGARRGRGRPLTDGRIAQPTLRHCLNLVSRFFGWAIERGHATINPVRQIPIGRRPQQSPRVDMPWLDDDAIVRTLISKLAQPINLMFYLGNQSGLRTGEICGLRLSDLASLDDGVIRVRFSYDGPLKEDKRGDGKVKWVPAAADAKALLSPWLAGRRAAGAGPEDLVFTRADGEKGCCRPLYLERAFDPVADELGHDLTWYQATRHSFTSRLLSRGASLDEVSAALGHSSPVVTRRYYDHFVRKSFSPVMRQGLGLTGGGEPGKILEMPKK